MEKFEKNFDLSKYLIKQEIPNNYDWGRKFYYTSDFVFLKAFDDPSFSKISGEQLVKAPTDFAVASGISRTINISANSWDDYFYQNSPVMLRSSTASANGNCLTDYINFSGSFEQRSVNFLSLGVAPSFSIRIPNEKEEIDNLKSIISTKIVNGEEKHILSAGQYPNHRASKSESEILEKLFQKIGGEPNGKLKPTGNFFTTNGQTTQWNCFSPKLSPEFEYNGNKYVRIKISNSPAFSYIYNPVLKYNDKRVPFLPSSSDAIWCKVEPIDFVIENYNNLPTFINENSKSKNCSNSLDLTSESLIFSSVPFFAESELPHSSLWLNSTIRAFLNSGKNEVSSKNQDIKNSEIWDFSKSGFLYEALVKDKTPIKEYTVPEFCTVISPHNFSGCIALDKIIIPSHVKHIKSFAFNHLTNTDVVIYPNKNLVFDELAFGMAVFKYIYLSSNTNTIILKATEDEKLNKTHYKFPFDETLLKKIANENYRKNLITLGRKKQNGKIKFIPKDYVLECFPNICIENYFIHNNHHKFRELVMKSEILSYSGEPLRTASLASLMKIYYAIGGFSSSESDREKAFRYAMEYLVPQKDKLCQTNHDYLCDLCDHFSQFDLKGEFNPTFAKFFMKYYHKDNNFLDDEILGESYLAKAHNNFGTILKFYPHKVVNTNNRQNILSPEFVKNNCELTEYNDVDEGNENLALIVGQYGYTQTQFDKIQKVFNYAKTLKDSYILKADKSSEDDPISYRILSKSDPLGFVLGNITNCCQKFGSVGESCVIDGYTNKNAGFIVFEEHEKNPDGTYSGEKVILGQAYIWYDPETKTVCFDNVEVPQSLVVKLEMNRMKNPDISSKTFVEAIKKSAQSIVNAMNREGHEVRRVTIGTAYNSLDETFKKSFVEEKNTKKLAKHRSYSGYTDADAGQYIVLDYQKKTKALRKNILQKISDGIKLLNRLDKKNSPENQLF